MSSEFGRPLVSSEISVGIYGFLKPFKQVPSVIFEFLEFWGESSYSWDPFLESWGDFRAGKAIFSSSLSKIGEVYTPETSCMKGTFVHIKNM